MSAPSGIRILPQDEAEFMSALNDEAIRFTKVQINVTKGSLEIAGSIPRKGTILEDFAELSGIIEDRAPAYIIAKLDEKSNQDGNSDWLLIYYVPETSGPKDRMVYASTKSVAMKLGSFVDFMDIHTKSELTAETYSAHRRYKLAPKPLSAREAELAEIKAAEREAYSGSEGGSGGRRHVGVELMWEPRVKDAFKDLVTSTENQFILLKYDPETQALSTATRVRIEQEPQLLPTTEPSFSFFASSREVLGTQKRAIIFIYSHFGVDKIRIKDRMIFSTGFSSVLRTVNDILREIIRDTSPKRLNEAEEFAELNKRYEIQTQQTEEALDVSFVKSLIVPSGVGSTVSPDPPTERREQQSFAKPKGPSKRR